MAEQPTGKFLGTICGKDKNPQPGLLPAHLRYLAPRIERVKRIADSHSFGFVILSGKFGLVQADDEIPYYDVLLTLDGVDAMAEKVTEQIQGLGIMALDFYGNTQKPTWAPYHAAIESATAAAGISLHLIEF